MGGYSVPQKIRSFNWLLKDGYSPEDTVRFRPAPEAYQPHTIVILEGSYPRKYGPGRKAAYEYVYRIVRPVDVEIMIKKYNSADAPPLLLESMDNAYWPWRKQMKRENKIAQANGLRPEGAAIAQECEAPNAGSNELADEGMSVSSDLARQEPVAPEPGEPQTKVQSLRDRYLPMLESEPFFRPLVTVTLPTRPLAVAFGHFLKSLSFGWTYHAFLAKHDTIEPKLAAKMKQYLPCLDVEHHKEKEKLQIQTRNLRLARVVEMTHRLGEFVVAARGGQSTLELLLRATDRTIYRGQLRPGEPAADIIIDVGVGTWYTDHDRLVNDFKDATNRVLHRFPGVMKKTQGEYSCPIVIRNLDAFGRQYDLETGARVPWPPAVISRRPETHIRFSGMIGKKNMIERQMQNRPPGESKDGFRDRLRKLQLEKDAVADIGMEYFEKYKYEIASWKSRTDSTHVTYLS